MLNALKKFKISDTFFDTYESLIISSVIPYQEKVLHDAIETVEKSHAIDNFRLAAMKLETGACDAPFYGMVFQDSDVAKWLEAAAYSLHLSPDEALEKRCDEVIELIGRAQWEDGYLNTYFTIKEPEKRWTNLEQAHELYCAGHMIEAAVAYAFATGKTKLLDIMCKMADHIYEHFVIKQNPGFPGHPEVEWALLRLYHATGNENYKTLAAQFINERGVDPKFYQKEIDQSDWNVWSKDPRRPNNEYSQCHLPVREQTEAVGHAVRAVYLYTAMAELSKITQDESLTNACKTLWENIVNKRMYITGAIGSAYEHESFTKDYHLPNDTAYAETCAAIGLIFFARNMLKLSKNSQYADVMERALYNGVLPGMSLDGTKFFYVNPLEVVPGISGSAVSQRHALPDRPGWFACACCPPNVARLLPSLPMYAYEVEDNVVYNHLYLGGELDLTDSHGSRIVIESSLPYGDKVTYKFEATGNSENPSPLYLAVRVPYWSKETLYKKNNQLLRPIVKEGYAYFSESLTDQDVIEVLFDQTPHPLYANEKITQNAGKMAFQKGPLIYCAEDADNTDGVMNLYVDKDSAIQTETTKELGGITKLIVDGYKISPQKGLYNLKAPEFEPTKITLIPYYTWDNRGVNAMRIWLPFK